ncbi:MAG: CHAT domain-containing protein, partial [Delftia sp.]|nr:CHAT domain-containing protein [Delftia sp.]
SRAWVDFRHADGALYEQRLAELVAALKGEQRLPERGGTELGDGRGGVRASGPLRRRLRIGPEAVVLDGGQPEASHCPAGLGHGAREKLWGLQRARAQPCGTGQESPLHRSQLEVGAALAEGFLDGTAGVALAATVGEARRHGASLELGLEVAAELVDLPWETLRLPAETAGGGLGPALALHPNVQLHRIWGAAAGPAPAVQIPGPLRILVAIGSPEEQNQRGELLDMETELARILDAVEPARKRGGAVVRVLQRGTVAAIRDALHEARYHVLHISCHARPGVLVLEDERGRWDKVTTQRLCEQALVADRRPALVVLAGCATARTEARPGGAADGEPAPAPLPGLARQLLAHGVPAVVAMQSSVSDRYAAAFGALMYRALATMERPDPLTALCEARRNIEAARCREDDRVDQILAERATP